MENWASPYLAAHAAYLRHLGTAPLAQVRAREGVEAVLTGVRSNSENGVLSRGAVGVEHARELIAWFAARGLPASWLPAEGEERAATAALLERCGCQDERAGWEMAAALDELAPARLTLPPGVEIAAVDSERALEGWLDVAQACGWFDDDADRRARRELLSGLCLSSVAQLRLHVALAGGRAVAMACAFEAGESVLLAGSAVLAGHRRAGIGRALALVRLADARERGCRLAVLGPSPDGAGLYRALGFETRRMPAGRWFYL